VSEPRVERFCKTTRWFHWTFALSFLALAVTGGALFLRESLGLSPAVTRELIGAHQIAAVFFLVAPWLVGLSGDTRRWLADLGEVLRFGPAERAWLRAGPRGWLGRDHLPGQGKLNLGQKANALVTALVAGASIASGLHLWQERGAFAALLVHLAGFFAWLPFFAVHVFMALVNPATRPSLRAMLDGRVPRAWAAHHHGAWLESLEREDAPR
jgi:formate dehydrogenase subunit gamma